MTDDFSSGFDARGDQEAVESGAAFQPKFDANGLIGAIVTERLSGAVLMFAHMNADALRRKIETGECDFWSRSRAKLWRKGEDSGNVLIVREIRVDCDQDAVGIIADVGGAGVACHTGRHSCFYRRLERRADAPGGFALTFVAPPTK